MLTFYVSLSRKRATIKLFSILDVDSLKTNHLQVCIEFVYKEHHSYLYRQSDRDDSEHLGTFETLYRRRPAGPYLDGAIGGLSQFLSFWQGGLRPLAPYLHEEYYIYCPAVDGGTITLVGISFICSTVFCSKNCRFPASW